MRPTLIVFFFGLPSGFFLTGACNSVNINTSNRIPDNKGNFSSVNHPRNGLGSGGGGDERIDGFFFFFWRGEGIHH